jgi:hypothetical protein
MRDGIGAQGERLLSLTLAATLLAAILTATAATAAPDNNRIQSITPTCAAPGAPVTVTGKGFGAQNIRITVAGVPAAVQRANGHSATFIVPTTAPSGPTTVTMAHRSGGQTGSITFRVGCGYTPAEGIVLPGPPSTLARAALTNLPPRGADPADIVSGVIMSRLDVRLAPDATVGQVNAALEHVGGGIVTMHPGSLGITIAIPRQRSAADLAALARALSGMPGLRLAWIAKTPRPTVLPFAPTSGNLHAAQQLLPTRFPAAWNARKLLDGCVPVPIVIPDFFGLSAPAAFASQLPGFPAVGASVSAPFHGYDVAATLGAAFDAAPPTGANPFTACLDLRPVQVGDLDHHAAIQAIADAFPPGKFLVSLSLGIDDAVCELFTPPLAEPMPVPCDRDTIGNSLTGALVRAQLALKWKELTHTRWLDFLAVSAAGNEANEDGATIYPGLASAAFSLWPQINRATDLPSLVLDGALWNPAPEQVPSLAATPDEARLLGEDIRVLGLDAIGPTDNVLVAGSTTALPPFPIAPQRLRSLLAASAFSNAGPDLSAVGEGIVCPEGPCVSQGTSFAAPQVAALASYLWLLSPQLRGLPAAVTAEAIAVNVFDDSALWLIDAYAAALSLDAAELPDPGNAPVRKALLDVNDDGRFDQQDLAAFVARFFEPQTGQPVEPTAHDFSRFDLNGDGFTGGRRRDRFDLDRVGSTQFGPTLYTVVNQSIAGRFVDFNESELTDLEILCYYAYSPLYTPALQEDQRGTLLAGRCADVTVSVQPGGATLAPGGTRQFGASVLGAENVAVTWTATGGTITATGLFTAGATPGTFTVRATSVADPRAFGEATVTVAAADVLVGSVGFTHVIDRTPTFVLRSELSAQITERNGATVTSGRYISTDIAFFQDPAVGICERRIHRDAVLDESTLVVGAGALSTSLRFAGSGTRTTTHTCPGAGDPTTETVLVNGLGLVGTAVFVNGSVESIDFSYSESHPLNGTYVQTGVLTRQAVSTVPNPGPGPIEPPPGPGPCESLCL